MADSTFEGCDFSSKMNKITSAKEVLIWISLRLESTLQEKEKNLA